MTNFEQGDVVLVAFPFTDRNARYKRPTLVVSARAIGQQWPLAWVLMITSAENRSWPGDILLDDEFGRSGLLDPSVIRTAKIANVELHGASRIGRLSDPLISRVLFEIRANLGLNEPQHR